MLARVYSRSSGLVSRRIGDEGVLVPIREQTARFAEMYSLNEVAMTVWELFAEERSLGSVREELLRIYEADEAAITSDLEELVTSLVERGMLEERATS